MSSSSVSTTASSSFSRCSCTRSAIESGIGCGPPSRPPEGSMYAHMWRRSTIPVSSCSLPIGSWIATQRSESCCRAASSTRKKSARSRSSMFTKRTRESSCSSARCQTREVLTSTPITPLRTTTTPSTTRSAANVSAWKPASPGVSTRLILRSFHSRWQSDARQGHARAAARARPSPRPSSPARCCRADSSSPPRRAAPRRVTSSRHRGDRRRRCCGSSWARWQPYGTRPPRSVRAASYPCGARRVGATRQRSRRPRRCAP